MQGKVTTRRKAVRTLGDDLRKKFCRKCENGSVFGRIRTAAA